MRKDVQVQASPPVRTKDPLGLRDLSRRLRFLVLVIVHVHRDRYQAVEGMSQGKKIGGVAPGSHHGVRVHDDWLVVRKEDRQPGWAAPRPRDVLELDEIGRIKTEVVS